MRSGNPSGRKAPSRERGAALLTVIVSVAVLTAMAVDLAYSSRVSLQIAANARDELRAHYLARSGVAMARMVLSLQEKVDGVPMAGKSAAFPRIQLWNLVPVGPVLTDGLFGRGGETGGKDAGAKEGPDSTFDARIEDEGRKVNAQLVGYTVGDQTLRLQAQALYRLVCDARWDPLFDREDAKGNRTSREDLLVRIRDWVESAQTGSALKLGDGSTAGTCGLIVGSPPFENAFGDKNQPYDRGEDRYKTKNARMDSLDELYLVAGIGDAFMAAFGDQLTVYLPTGAPMNVNADDKQKLMLLASLFALAPGDPALLDVEFADRLAKLMREQTMNGMFALNPQGFGNLVLAAGVNVDQNKVNATNSPFTDRSTTFRIRAKGSVGAVQTSIDAVVRMGEQAQQGEQTALPGKLIHWRED
jgi:general secretion pathway protein K